jgi:hypothetical protein
VTCSDCNFEDYCDVPSTPPSCGSGCRCVPRNEASQSCVCVNLSAPSDICDLDSDCPPGFACVPFRNLLFPCSLGTCVPLCTA